MKNIRLRTFLGAAAIAAVLGGCGSSDHDDAPVGSTPTPTPTPTPTNTVPASAQSSVDGLIAYMNDLIKTMTSDTSEPVMVGDAVLPTSETTEPAAVTN